LPQRAVIAGRQASGDVGKMSRIIRACCVSLVFLLYSGFVLGQDQDRVLDFLRTHQLNFATEGRALLVEEARRASFFLVGGLHGDNETPALVQDLAGALRPFGYRYIAGEMSPWAASRLQASQRIDGAPTFWGTDIEEVQPHLAIRDLAAMNPQSRELQSMSEMTKAGYRRRVAPQLLQLMRQAGDVRDVSVGGTSLRSVIVRTLEVEVDRLDPALSLSASDRRETFMKELFVERYREATRGELKPKVMVVFGQNHLHRGIDGRGVSTLGNFIAELAVTENVQSFHVALFAAGGKVALGGLQDADQRKDDPAFEVLASVARFPVTVFDLRPLRQLLHNTSLNKLSSRDASLQYWADSYDVILCYREVTPAGVAQPGN
jgi:hypothetical protein